MAGRCRTTGALKYPSKERAERSIRALGGSHAFRCPDHPSHWHVAANEDPADPAHRRWTTAEWDQATLALWARCRDLCEWCGDPLRGEMARHHRQRRQLGHDRLSNLVALHTDCHRYVHAHPAEARATGHIVSAYEDDPAAVVIYLPRQPAGVLLTDEGTMTAA